MQLTSLSVSSACSPQPFPHKHFLSVHCHGVRDMGFLRHTFETDLVVFKESMGELRVNQAEADDYICRVGALLHLTSLFARLPGS